jgi:hypothetical protein
MPWIPSGTLPISGFAVFGRGTDNRLWWRHQSSAGWSGWAPLGGVLTSKPTVAIGAAVAPDALSVFVRGPNGSVLDRTLHGTPNPGEMEWTPWVSLGGKLLPGTAPASAGNASGLFVAAVGPSPNAVVAFVRGTDSQPWSKSGTWPALSSWVRVPIDY